MAFSRIDKDRFESRYFTMGLLQRWSETSEKMSVLRKQKNNFYSKKRRLGKFSSLYVCMCTYFSENGKYLVASRLSRGYFVTRLFINGNKLRIFLENFVSYCRLRLHKTGNLEKVYTKHRIYISNIYTEKENPLKRNLSVDVRGDGLGRKRKALHGIYLSRFFPITEEIWQKKLSFWNLNRRVKRVNPSMTGRRADAKLFRRYHHEHPEPGAAGHRTWQRGKLHVSRQQWSWGDDESDCEPESTV